jgi:acetyltransferase-like isoleucine patch superfamily enzyme
VAPGIMMEKESVLLANSNLTKNTKKNSVYAGNPAKFKKKRY